MQIWQFPIYIGILKSLIYLIMGKIMDRVCMFVSIIFFKFLFISNFYAVEMRKSLFLENQQ